MKAPLLRISGKRVAHIYMQGLLEIESRLAEGAHHDIRADAAILGHVAAGIRELHVCCVIEEGDSYLLARPGEKIFEGGCRCAYREGDGREKEGAETHAP